MLKIGIKIRQEPDHVQYKIFYDQEVETTISKFLKNKSRTLNDLWDPRTRQYYLVGIFLRIRTWQHQQSAHLLFFIELLSFSKSVDFETKRFISCACSDILNEKSSVSENHLAKLNIPKVIILFGRIINYLLVRVKCHIRFESIDRSTWDFCVRHSIDRFQTSKENNFLGYIDAYFRTTWEI